MGWKVGCEWGVGVSGGGRASVEAAGRCGGGWASSTHRLNLLCITEVLLPAQHVRVHLHFGIKRAWAGRELVKRADRLGEGRSAQKSSDKNRRGRSPVATLTNHFCSLHCAVLCCNGWVSTREGEVCRVFIRPNTGGGCLLHTCGARDPHENGPLRSSPALCDPGVSHS